MNIKNNRQQMHLSNLTKEVEELQVKNKNQYKVLSDDGDNKLSSDSEYSQNEMTQEKYRNQYK